eukprot:6209445-Pleurochrysis_carterae.AAC.1
MLSALNLHPVCHRHAKLAAYAPLREAFRACPESVDIYVTDGARREPIRLGDRRICPDFSFAPAHRARLRGVPFCMFPPLHSQLCMPSCACPPRLRPARFE